MRALVCSCVIFWCVSAFGQEGGIPGYATYVQPSVAIQPGYIQQPVGPGYIPQGLPPTGMEWRHDDVYVVRPLAPQYPQQYQGGYVPQGYLPPAPVGYQWTYPQQYCPQTYCPPQCYQPRSCLGWARW